MPEALPYSPQREYRPPRRLRLRPILLATLLSLLAAILAAAVIFLWHLSPVPIYIAATGVVQGGILVGLLILAFRWSKLHSPLVAGALCVIAAFASATLVHYALYLRDVYQFRNEIRQE